MESLKKLLLGIGLFIGSMVGFVGGAAVVGSGTDTGLGLVMMGFFGFVALVGLFYAFAQVSDKGEQTGE